LPKEQFAYRETQQLLQTLDQAAHTSGVSRGQAFEDFLHMSVCALAGGTLEDQYLQVVQKHTPGKPGERGCDRIAHLFGQLVHVMEETRKDILGDLFQGAITYGEAGQFFTPESVTQLMTAMTVGQNDVDPGVRRSVCDPCCGSGRMLLSVAERQPHWEFVGQDIDLRCVRMTAINLALRNLYGYVIWGNSLCDERKLIYRTVFNGRGCIREEPLADCPLPVQAAAVAENVHSRESNEPVPASEPPRPATQLRFF
jgi:hypothetical protein